MEKNNTTKSSRLPEYDVMKGILIIFVVLGHIIPSDTSIHRIIFLFHMPVFFMLTGLLSHWNISYKNFITKRVKAYVIPYFTWSFIVFIAFWPESPLKFTMRTVYGGAMNTTHYTYQFWYICALFVASIFFNLIYNYKKKILYPFLGLFLLLWYLFINQHTIHPLPWSLESVPFVLFYFELGHLIGNMEKKYSTLSLTKYIHVTSFIIVTIIVIAYLFGYYQYSLNIRAVELKCFIADSLYPILFFLSIKGISLLLSKTHYTKQLFIYIGKSSLVIMFSHVSILYLIKQKNLENILPSKWLYYSLAVLLSVAIGCLLNRIFEQNKYISRLFLGK